MRKLGTESGPDPRPVESAAAGRPPALRAQLRLAAGLAFAGFAGIVLILVWSVWLLVSAWSAKGAPARAGAPG